MFEILVLFTAVFRSLWYYHLSFLRRSFVILELYTHVYVMFIQLILLSYNTDYNDSHLQYHRS